MHWKGHVGTAILCYAPFYAWLVATASTTLALVGLLVTIVCAPLPDVDTAVPITHRGPTHTVWFVSGVTAIASGAGVVLAPLVGLDPAGSLLAVGGAAALSLTSHVLLDGLTPMGIRPFEPLSSASISLKLVASRNRGANMALLLIGSAVFLTVMVGSY